MKTLHILRSAPDEMIEKLIKVVTHEDPSTVRALYKGDIDWSALVDDIFTHDKVICWW